MKTILKIVVVVVLFLRFIVSAPAIPTVTQISAGDGFVLFLKSDGSLWTAGYNVDGQTGNPDTYSNEFPYYFTNPIQVVSNGVTAIAAGGNFSLFLKSDGSLWGMGSDLYGQLGLTPILSNTNVPEKIIGSNVVAISAGENHTIYRSYTVTGSLGNQTITMLVEGMGNDTYGQLGNYATKSGDNYPSPVTIEFESTKFFPSVTPVCAGSSSSFFIETDGTLWAMGDNQAGELGDGTTNTPPGIKQVPGAANVTAVASEAGHTMFVESDGSLWTMGIDTLGEGGEGTTNVTYYPTPQKIIGSNVVGVSTGLYHSLFLKSDGTLWGMGLNSFGELSPNNLNDYYPSPRQVASNVVNFAAGAGVTYYTKTDGSTWAVGLDNVAQLGDGFSGDTSSNAVQIFPYLPPVFTKIALTSPTNLQLTATCPVGGSYFLLWTTNINQPLSTWDTGLGELVASRGPNNFNYGIDPRLTFFTPPRYFALKKQ
ncbi:MAG: hypothetical protein JWR19_1037 [Pedosphaera sp.]|nr:hypothetical protein [Pedosphaera sp.]